MKTIERGAVVHSEHDFGNGCVLDILDRRNIGRGFTGRFHVPYGGSDSSLPYYETGMTPEAVFMKFAERPHMAPFAGQLVELASFADDMTIRQVA